MVWYAKTKKINEKNPLFGRTEVENWGYSVCQSDTNVQIHSAKTKCSVLTGLISDGDASHSEVFNQQGFSALCLSGKLIK